MKVISSLALTITFGCALFTPAVSSAQSCTLHEQSGRFSCPAQEAPWRPGSGIEPTGDAYHLNGDARTESDSTEFNPFASFQPIDVPSACLAALNSSTVPQSESGESAGLSSFTCLQEACETVESSEYRINTDNFSFETRTGTIILQSGFDFVSSESCFFTLGSTDLYYFEGGNLIESITYYGLNGQLIF